MSDNVIVRTLRDSDKEQVKALWKICFDDTDKFTDWFFCERWCADYGVAVEFDGNIVTAIQGWRYTLNIRGKEIPACIMSGVSTHPEYRRRGYMSQALARFMENARGRGESIVFCKPAKHSAYFKYLHYTSSEICLTSLGDDCTCVSHDEVKISEADGISPDLLMDAYKNCIETYSNSVNRSQSDMALKLRDYASSDGKVMYVTENEKIIAYCACTASVDGITVEEVCAPNAETRDMLLDAIIALCNGKKCAIKLPCDMANKILSGFISEVIPNGAMGASDISFLLRELAGFGDMTVGVVDHILPSNNGVFSFNGEHSAKPCDIVIDSGHLLQLLNGFYSIDELIENDFCRIINTAVVEKMRERFPKLKCYTAEEY